MQKPPIHKVFTLKTPHNFNPVRNNQREVVFLLQNKEGKILLITKRYYPPGLFRLPSGQPHPGETISQAFEREVYEEIGFKPKKYDLSAVVETRFTTGFKTKNFISYIFSADFPLIKIDLEHTDKEISNYKFVPKEELNKYLANMLSLPSSYKKWLPWANFRSLAFKAAIEILR